MGEDRVSAYEAVVTHRYLAEEHRSGADCHIIANPRRTSMTASVSKSNPMVEGTVAAEFDGGMQNDAAEVVNPKPRAYLTGCGNRDPC
jgi:hypothetical protein